MMKGPREQARGKVLRRALTHVTHTHLHLSAAALPVWGVDGALTASSPTSLSVDAAKTVFQRGILRLRLQSSQNDNN